MRIKRLSILLLLSFILLSFLPLVYAAPLFENGYEAGDTAWSFNSGYTVSDPVHHGSLAGKYNASSMISSFHFGADKDPAYCRLYFRTDGLPSSGNSNFFFEWKKGDDILTYTGIKNVAGTTYFVLVYRNSGDSLVSVVSSKVCAVNTWYSAEMYWERNTLDGATLYIDGENEATAGAGTTKDTAVDQFYVGSPYVDDAHDQFIDCVVADQSYIGPEVEGLNLSFELNQSILISENHVFSKELAFLQTNTIQPSDVVSMSKAIGGLLTAFLSTNSIYPSATLLFNKELAFWKYDNLFTSATSTMTKAVQLTLFELFEFVKLHASNIMLPGWTALTIEIAVAIGVLALVLAICGISLVVLRRRRE